jgi:hypothetical protein
MLQRTLIHLGITPQKPMWTLLLCDEMDWSERDWEADVMWRHRCSVGARFLLYTTSQSISFLKRHVSSTTSSGGSQLASFSNSRGHQCWLYSGILFPRCDNVWTCVHAQCTCCFKMFKLEY